MFRKLPFFLIFEKKSIKTFLHIIIILVFLICEESNLNAQTRLRDYVDVKILNDDAGELSTRMKTGDDLGETYTSHLSYHNFNLSTKFNFAIAFQSTLYTALDKTTKKIPRDVQCNERNSFQIMLNNKKLQSFFYSLFVGFDYIQSTKPSVGASGQAKWYHEKIINPNFPTKYWIYNYKGNPSRFFPFLEARYGFTHNFIENKNFYCSLSTEAGVQLSTDPNFSEVRSVNQLTAAWYYGKTKAYSIQYDFEYFFSGNFLAYQNNFIKNLISFKFHSFEMGTGITVPIVKNIYNPFLPYNDKEIMFHYNVRVYIGKLKKDEKEG